MFPYACAFIFQSCVFCALQYRLIHDHLLNRVRYDREERKHERNKIAFLFAWLKLHHASSPYFGAVIVSHIYLHNQIVLYTNFNVVYLPIPFCFFLMLFFFLFLVCLSTGLAVIVYWTEWRRPSAFLSPLRLPVESLRVSCGFESEAAVQKTPVRNLCR